MEESEATPDALPFAGFLGLVWACLTALFWGLGGSEASVYFALLYISFLGVLELGSALGLPLPDQRLLNLTIAAGFGGWVLSLAAYLIG